MGVSQIRLLQMKVKVRTKYERKTKLWFLCSLRSVITEILFNFKIIRIFYKTIYLFLFLLISGCTSLNMYTKSMDLNGLIKEINI
jgi:hypothetical protein